MTAQRSNEAVAQKSIQQVRLLEVAWSADSDLVDERKEELRSGQLAGCGA